MKKEIETLVTKEEENKQKQNKNSVILIFTVLGAMIGIIVIAIAFFWGPMLNRKKPLNKQPKTVINNDNPSVLAQYRISGNSLDDFDLAFMKLENKQENEVYSPLSIKYALSMLSTGADKDSKKQIDSIIGDYKTKKYTNDEHMSFANAMFIRNSFKDNIKQDYIKKLRSSYNAEVVFDEFNNADTMNNWVNEKTFKLINNLFDNETVSKQDFILTNALAIDMEWNNLLQCASTKANIPCKRYNVNYLHEKYSDYVSYVYDDNFPAMKFNNKDNIKSVEIGASINRYDIIKKLGEDNIREKVTDAYTNWLQTDEGKFDLKYNQTESDVTKYIDKYMEELKSNYKKVDQSTDFYIYNDDNVKAFAKNLKKYSGTELQYIGIMPKKEALDKYVDNITKEDLSGIISGLKDISLENFKDGVVTKIHGNIPMFKFDYELQLKEDLQKLGVVDVFDSSKSNLSNMLNKEGVIDSASHKASIEFSNDGIKAAAATQMGGVGSAGGGFKYDFEVPVEEIDITFDKPYMFIIRDTSSGEVWFTGMVYNPIVK